MQPRIIIEDDGYDADAAERFEKEQRELLQRDRELQAEQGGPVEEEEESESDDHDDPWKYLEERYKSKYIVVPEPGPYRPRTRTSRDEDVAHFNETFSANNLQVIVKLANIHLTPEKPTYDDGSWHIEVMSSLGLLHTLQPNKNLRACPTSTSVPVRFTSTTART